MLRQIPDVWKISDKTIQQRMEQLQQAIEKPQGEDDSKLQVVKQRIDEFISSLQRATTPDQVNVPFQD